MSGIPLPRRRSAAFSLVSVCLLAACDPGPLLPDEGAGGASGSGAAGAAGTDDSLATGRVARLSHQQWENSVRDLLRLPEPSGLSATFPMEAQGGGYLFDNPADSLQVEQALWGAYGAAAATLAEAVTSSSWRLGRLVPRATDDDGARARAFIVDFGQRAFRRPLSDAEISSYLELYAAGVSAYDDASGFVAGVRLVIETMLQSPYFLYRVEAVGATDEEPALSDWEVAQRLSFFLVNSTPDDALLQAARSGELATADGVRGQVARLLAEPEAQAALRHFHDQLLNLPTYTGISPSPALFPEVSANLGSAALASTRALLDDLVFNRQQGFADLMTTTRAFVNADLAPVYGLSGSFDAELVPVELPDDERRGLFTQAGFLAANATAINPDPIHRGVFIAKRVLCRSIAAPPDNVTPLPPSGIGTNRQIVEEHTQSRAGCAVCHEHHINPYGFVFESYDASGAFRTVDNGLPVDTGTTALLDGGELPLAGALDFADALSASREAHDCFARHLVEFALGRNASTTDQPMIQSLGQASLDGEPIVELLSTIARATSFSGRGISERGAEAAP